MNKKLTTFYIVRHGQTENNIKRIVQGHNDSPLTKEGIKALEEMAKKFKSKKFDLAFSSDLLRAKRTAETIAIEHNLTVQTTQLLRERSFGDFEGKPFEAIDAYREYVKNMSDKKLDLNSIENDEKVVSRMKSFIKKTAMKHTGKTVLAATHGSLIRVFLIHTGFGTDKTLPIGSVNNLAWLKLETDGDNFFVRETKGINKIEN